MERLNEKGSIFIGMIIMVAIYIFAVLVVVIFFYFFKYNISIIILDEYRWNKVQEVPLSLLSMDVDGESFISKVNKAYYNILSDEEKKQFQTDSYSIITNQMFYEYQGIPPEIGFNILIGSVVKITKGDPDCRCLYSSFTCSDECPEKTRGQDCTITMYPGGPPLTDDKKCFIYGYIYYSEKYPIPLVFNGTDKFVDVLSYDVVEVK